MTTREKIEEILNNHSEPLGDINLGTVLANYGVVGEKNAMLKRVILQAHQAAIQEAVIEELNKLQELDNEYTRVGLQPGHRYLGFFNHINDRLDELSNNKEEE